MADESTKVIYTEIDEEVASILDRLKAEKEDNIEIAIPRRALILQSLVSLKLLQKQAKKLGKKITVITTDKKGRDLASSVGINTKTKATKQERVAERKEEKDVVINKEEKKERKHGSKSIEEVIESVKEPEIIEGEHHEGKVTIKTESRKAHYKHHHQAKAHPKQKTHHHMNASLEAGTLNRKLLVFFTSLSLVMLAVVFMIVLPSTTISIKPKADVLSYDANIKVADAEDFADEIESNPNRYIPSYPVRAESQITETFQTTGIAQNSQSATGEIVIHNEGPRTQSLIKRTRFKTEDGIIFRLQDRVDVPAKGTITAKLIADPLDEAGEVVGARGNIEPQKLTVPGLREANQKIVYGIVEKRFAGGVSEATKIVSEDDINAAKTKLLERLKDDLYDQLDKEIKSLSRTLDKNLKLLDVESAIKQVETEVILLDDVQPNDARDDFTLSVGLKIEGVAYDFSEFKRILDRGLQGRVTPDTKIEKINYDELRYDILGEEAGEYIIDANIEALIKYDIDGYYRDIIVSNISGKSLDEAIKYLQSQNYLTGKAKVRMWPFWLTKVPTLSENIKIKEL